ncbi:MAG: LysR family transcriptional regulator [Caldilineaceae bacterium]
MELRVLKYFLMVAREENITKAAELLHVTQPTLSRQLAQLEDELGTKLFQRGQHGITLTEDGLLLRRRAVEIVALADKTERELSHADDALSGEITIGSGETKSIHALIGMMAAFRRQHPDVTFDMYTAAADDIKEHLDRGLADVGVVVEPVEISQYHFLRLPGNERAGVLLRTDSPLAEKAVIRPEDLVGTPLLMVKRPYFQNELTNWFGAACDQMEIVATYNLIYNAAMMVQHHMGVALCLELESQFDGLCFRPLEPTQENGTVLIWKKEQMLPATTRAFIEYTKKYLIDIVKDNK